MEQFQSTLDGAIFATAAVQDVKHAIKPALGKLFEDIFSNVDWVHVNTTLAQAVQHRCTTLK